MSGQRYYYVCKFRPGDKRTYTYHSDGVTYRPGQIVKVPDRSGDGWQTATIERETIQLPPFPTKAIIGLADAPQTESPQLI
jgi:hypothetical protein